MTLTKIEHDHYEDILRKGIKCSFHTGCNNLSEEIMMIKDDGTIFAYCKKHYEGLVKVLGAVKTLSEKKQR